jgi:hypothetical protein
MAETGEYSADAGQSAQQALRTSIRECLRQHKDITRSWRMIGEDKLMAELPWASKESKNLVAASASRYASSA